MSGPNGIERRDPASGILKLGALLSSAHWHGWTGALRVLDRGLVHSIPVIRGNIAAGSSRIDPLLQQLFVLPRPFAVFEERPVEALEALLIDPEPLVVQGVKGRRDLFEPRTLVERIPVEVLRLSPKVAQRLGQFGLDPDETAFVHRLTVPTPLTLALWKRGLDPGHASAVVVALNLLGAFEEWRPGDLPRPSLVSRLCRMIRNATPDHELFGVDADAPQREVDRAFRKLSLVLHPDRFMGMSGPEAERAKETFVHLSRAHARLRRSRRSRSVGRREAVARTDLASAGPDTLAGLVHCARVAADRGDISGARRFAVKALALSPPKDTAVELKALLRRVA
jgi:hypothetical protein